MNKIVSLKGYEPVQQTKWSAWFDIKARWTWYLAPGEIVLIPTGVKVAMDLGTVCLVFIRSSLPLKKGLMLANGVGVVDCDYRWEIGVQIYNANDYEVKIDDMERIWQLVFTKYSDNVYDCDTEMYDNRETAFPTKRWTGWFGSTGN